MRERALSDVWRLVWLLCLVLATSLAQTSQVCPSHGEIAPCYCSVKKSGLDIVCEITDLTHISKAMVVLKGRPNLVIFYLRLRHNTLPKLQGYVFLGLDIRHLTIHNSSLAVLEESSLSSIGTGLTQLDLSQNSLSSVPSHALKDLHHLLILNLNRNKITAIHGKAFEGLDTLEILTLYENKISIIEADAFKGLDNRRLKRLNLGGNELTRIPTQALSSLELLKKLEMQENRISSIKEGDFEGLKALDSLGLAHNHLREVPARVFSHLTQLNSLELDGNQITHVDANAFIGLEENLQYLRLGDNNLHMVPSDALRRLHRLRHLDLRSNNITVLPEDAFTGYGDSITFLNLQKNMIKILPPLVFENLNSLETLSLQNNRLTHIPEEVTENIVDTLRHIDMTDNPLICDCELRWYSVWLGNLRDKDDEMMSKKRTVCMMVSEHREYSVQSIPLDRMGCVGKNAGKFSSSAAGCRLYLDKTLPLIILILPLIILTGVLL
ncbi:PREDICTED: slit homolog 1 protein [Acromyrmex echinatior]|uniref:Leucine-rich repeats and immunoglobulin-like domains protein 2 n=2 Tax=Acromyrmex TaxID=64782 RepID=F4WZ82_ACREC